jgi:hypothetical protein
MAAGKQKQIPLSKAIPEIIKVIGKDKLDVYSITDKFGEFADPGEG